ncbi:hypothetical protein SKAU_G00215350 [Synaphobranchus kaupii]|uniref:Uncharacterized protein n=1 Tax=Synaphobranchus kaupii TaxID=118154 RepID=A0A9Q1FA53_SYNKA|nr:hypothetical protein SKAU_G00215350 [Synaphobranchus kaupii]
MDSRAWYSVYTFSSSYLEISPDRRVMKPARLSKLPGGSVAVMRDSYEKWPPRLLSFLGSLYQLLQTDVDFLTWSREKKKETQEMLSLLNSPGSYPRWTHESVAGLSLSAGNGPKHLEQYRQFKKLIYRWAGVFATQEDFEKTDTVLHNIFTRDSPERREKCCPLPPSLYLELWSQLKRIESRVIAEAVSLWAHQSSWCRRRMELSGSARAIEG